MDFTFLQRKKEKTPRNSRHQKIQCIVNRVNQKEAEKIHIQVNKKTQESTADRIGSI